MSFLYSSIAGILAGILASMGLGGGGILIIYLTIFQGIDQQIAQGINLAFFIPVSLVSVVVYYKKKLINLKMAILSSSFGILGAILGSFLSYQISTNILSKIFGCLLLIMGINQLFPFKNITSSALPSTDHDCS